MITEKDVNDAFDTLEETFKRLAPFEDKMNQYAEDLLDLKEGSRKSDQIKKKMIELKPKLNDATRAYRLAGMRADRLRMLLNVHLTALGRD
jgi:hypothetical protein